MFLQKERKLKRSSVLYSSWQPLKFQKQTMLLYNFLLLCKSLCTYYLLILYGKLILKNQILKFFSARLLGHPVARYQECSINNMFLQINTFIVATFNDKNFEKADRYSSNLDYCGSLPTYFYLTRILFEFQKSSLFFSIFALPGKYLSVNTNSSIKVDRILFRNLRYKIIERIFCYVS